MPPGEGIRLELVEENELSGAAPPSAGAPAPLSRHRQLRKAGRPAWKSRSAAPTASSCPTAAIGKVCVRGASVMVGYFRDPESTEACLSDDGWLDTGDMGYCRAATSSSSAAPRT